MNFLGKLEHYFSSGTPEKQNKKRVGGLLIGITALLLAIAIVALAIVSVVMLIEGIVGNIKDENDVKNSEEAVKLEVTDLGTVDLAAAANTFSFDDTAVLADGTGVKKLTTTHEGYTCASNHGLQTEAADAFNLMMTDFYNAKKEKVNVVAAYSIDEDNSENFKNALAVKLNFKNADDVSTSIYNANGAKDWKYDWIYDNAAKYGFVPITMQEENGNVFRYVGLASAKYIASKQGKVDLEKNEDYTIADFLNEVRAGEITVRSVDVSLEEDAKRTTHYIYFVSATPATADDVKLPIAGKYTYTVSKISDGYVVEYHK